jgi:hypothetical protein
MFRSLALSCLCVVAMSSVSRAQQPQKPPPPNPLAPNVAMPFPMGLQRGTTLELTLTGSNLANPTGAWVGMPGKVTIPTEDKNGQDAAKLKVRIEVPADVPLGVYALRLANKQGVSNLRLLAVDDLPQVVETDKNRSKSTPQPLPIPCVVAGRADAEQSDYFKITVKPGQQISLDVLGRRLGSAIDPQLSLYHGKTGRELAHDNDAPGCQSDARMVYTFKEAGEYVIEIKDVLNRGGADYVYRLRVGEFPLATVPIPMAARRGSKVKVEFAGPMTKQAGAMDVSVPKEPGARVLWVSPKGASGQHGWPVPLIVSDAEESIEQEPNMGGAKANRLAVPGGVTGRFQISDDADNYVFSAKKGQKLTIEGQTLEWGSPTLVYLLVKNAKTNAELAKSNPQAVPPADQKIDFTAPEDGDYVLEVQHLNYLGGPSEAYHISVQPARADFDVSLLTERADVAAQSVAAFPLQVTRRGYTGPIEVSAVGSAGIVGSTTIKAGQNAGVLLLQTKGDVPLGPQALTLQAKATIDGKPATEWVSARAAVGAALSGLPYPPLHLHNHVAVGVKERAPFSLAVKMEHAEGVPGLPASVIVTAKRDAGFGEEIVLNTPANLPPNVPAPKIANIAKDKNELKFNIDINAKTPLGDYVLLFSGKAKKDKAEIAGDVTALQLVVTQPFALKVEGGPVNLAPGEKAKIKVTAQRKGGYKGPIGVELRNLPAKVTAGKSTIAADQTGVEIELAAAADAAAAEATNVDAQGTATALNNLQNASAAFVVRVQKK